MDRIKIELDKVNAWYGDNHVLKDISLQIYEKRVTAIIGPSGCGKSTLLRVINRLHETVDAARVEGKVLLDGRDIYDKDVDPVDIRRRIGMIFQQPVAFPHLSIYDNVAIGLKLNGLKDKARLDKIVEESLREAALWNEVCDRLMDKGVSLSGGQKQRLAIARAIALKPEVILMDEPTSSLDPVAGAKVEDLIINLKKNYTIVLVTHNIQQAARVADYIAFLYMGRLIEFGPARRVLESPEMELTEKYLIGEFG